MKERNKLILCLAMFYFIVIFTQLDYKNVQNQTINITGDTSKVNQIENPIVDKNGDNTVEVFAMQNKLSPISINQKDINEITYETLGEENYDKSILFENTYTNLDGILTFRGNNYRDSASFGVSNIKNKKLEEGFKFNTASSYWGAGAGWTGQPVIVKWPEESKQKMNIYDEFKRKKDFTEIIYSSLDGNIYFLDLDTGKPSRDKIRVGNPIKGSLSIDPRGLPLLYTGEGIEENDTVGFNIYSLIDGKQLYEINGMDKDAYRRWPAFDSSCLVFGESDTVIEAGENGILYIIKLNSNYNEEENTITINPKLTKYRYTIGDEDGRLGIENSVAAYGNLLYFADNNGDIQCIDLKEMKPMWIVHSGDDTDASLTLEVEDNVPYIYTGTEVDHQGTTGISTLRKINGLTAEVIWNKEFKCDSIIGDDAVNGGLMATNVIGKNKISDKVIFSLARYKGMNKGATLALDKNTGETLWEKDFNNYAWSSPVDFYDKDGNGYLIQCDSVGNMFLLDGENGQVLNSILLNGNVEASPSIFEDTVVVATRNGTIYGVNIK